MINYSRLIITIIIATIGWLQIYAQPLSTPDLNFFEVKGKVKTISYMDDIDQSFGSCSEIRFNSFGFLDIEDVHIKRDVNNRLIVIGDTKIKWGGEHVSEIYMNYTCTQIFYNNKGLCARMVYTKDGYGDVRQDVVDVIYNKFDDYGNWTMRTVINVKTGEKKTERRFITYYSDNELSVKLLDADNSKVDVKMVYSNMYDGYLNVRAEPSTNSKILGKLPNGPEGAALLGVEGKWTKVRVNGVEGYVWSAYLQQDPSEPVYISASVVVGEWSWADEYAHFDSYTIKSNGEFYCEGYHSMENKGSWYLSHDKIVLKYSDGTIISCPVKGKTIKINGLDYHKE